MFSDPATTARRAIRTVLIEKEAEDKRAVEQVIDDVFMRKIMVYSYYLLLTRVVCISGSEGARMGLWGLVTPGWRATSK
jgi:hypothetical protein